MVIVNALVNADGAALCSFIVGDRDHRAIARLIFLVRDRIHQTKARQMEGAIEFRNPKSRISLAGLGIISRSGVVTVISISGASSGV